jgi:hypothetical protein
MKRNRRAAVKDLWLKTLSDENGNTTTVPSALHGRGSRWRARYVDGDGRERAKQFPLKAQTQRWLDRQTSKVVQGTHAAPRDAKITVEQWCERWFEGYKGNRPNSVNSARTMIRMIVREFGHLALSEARPSQVKTWCARMKTDGYAVSTISRAHRSPVGLERQTEHTSHEVGFHQLRLTGDEVGHLAVQFAQQ